jgi:hypothetical protein
LSFEDKSLTSCAKAEPEVLDGDMRPADIADTLACLLKR